MTQVLIDREVLEGLIESMRLYSSDDAYGALFDVLPELRAALEAKPQEPVAWVKYSCGAMPKFSPVIAGCATFDCPAPEALEYQPLYAAPVAEQSARIAELEAQLSASEEVRKKAEKALSVLRDAVIGQNKLGASWHPAVFADMMQGLADSSMVLNAIAQAKEQEKP